MTHLLDYCLIRSREMVGDWCGPHQAEYLEVWRLEHTTLLAAFAWALARPSRVDDAAELFILLRYHWIAGGHLSDGRRWADRILGLDDLSPHRRGQVLAVTAWVCLIQGDRDAALARLEDAHQLGDVASDSVLHAYLDSYGALLALFAGRLDDAVAGYRACIPVLLEAGEQAAAQTAMFQLGMAQTYLGRTEEALETCREEESAEKLLAAGVETSVQRFDGLAHGVFWLSGAVPRCKEQRVAAADFLRMVSLDGLV